MAEPDGGYVLIYRRLLDHPAFRSPAEAMAFAFLVAKASWRPCRVRYKERTLVLERGQVAISVRDFATAMERSKSWADRFLRRLTNRDMIGTVDGTGVNVITICNYDEYQVPVMATGTGIIQKPGQDRDTTGTQNNKGNTGKEGNTTPIKPPSRATAWPTSKEFPSEWMEWARKDRGWSKSQVEEEAARFVDSALAKHRTYADWFAAWRQWCRSPFQKTVAQDRLPLTL